MADTLNITSNVIDGNGVSANVSSGVTIVTSVNTGTSVSANVITGGKGDSTPIVSKTTQTSNFTASINSYYPVDATSAAITVNLPTSMVGQYLAIKKTDASTNIVTLSGLLNGAVSSLPLRLQNQGKLMIADNAGGWNIIAGDLNLPTLDTRYVNQSTGIAGYLTAGTNVTLTGSGTSASPYVVSASGGAGSGNVTGPATSTDNAVTRYDGTTGQLIQDSLATLDDNGVLTLPTLNIGSGTFTTTPFDLNSGDLSISNPSASNSVGRNISFRTNSTTRAQISGFRDSAASGGNMRFLTTTGTTLTERMRLDSSGFLGIKITAPDSELHVNGNTHFTTLGNTAVANFISANQASITPVSPSLQMVSTTAADSSLLNARFIASTAAATNLFVKSRATTAGTHAVVANGDFIGNIGFDADDGSTFTEAARIRAVVDSATITTGSVAGRVEIMTTPVGGTQATIGFTVDSANNVFPAGGKIGPSATQQHTLPAVTSDTFTLNAASQTLQNKTLTAPIINQQVPTNTTSIITASTITLTTGNRGGVYYFDATLNNITVNMPATTTPGYPFRLVRLDNTANTVTITAVTTPVFDTGPGTTGTSIPLQGATTSVDLQSTATNGTWKTTNQSQAFIPESSVTNLVSDLASKQPNLTLTTTGTSGAATLVGATLNIPQYSGGGGGSGITRSISTVTTTVTGGTTANTDYVYFLSTGAVFTLPTAVSNTNAYMLKNITTSNMTVNTTSSQTVDGGALSLTPNSTVTLLSDGSNWQIGA